MEQFWDHLKRSLVGGGLVPTSLTADELRDSKYATWEWNFGGLPPGKHGVFRLSKSLF